LDRPAGTRPAFNLWRDQRSVQDEEYERGYPRREAATLLRDMRNLCRLTPEERKSYKGDWPFVRFPNNAPAENSPEGKALRDLTDAQIDALLDGQKIALDPTLFSKEIADFRQQRRKDYLRIQNIPPEQAASAPALPDIPPAISVTRADSDSGDPERETRFHLNLEGVVEGSTNLDVYDTNAHPDPSRVPPAAILADPAAPRVDLTPLLGDKAATPEQRDSLSFTLQALARTARINIYSETFLKKPFITYGARSGGLTTFKGTVPNLIAAICAEWNYQAQKVGDDYLFWSRTWAEDRAVDVPDRLLSRWRARQQKQGVLTLTDREEIAAALTWPQVALTLTPALPQAAMSAHEYKALRLLGTLSPVESDAAFSARGLALAEASPLVQRAFAADMGQQAAQTLSDDSNSIESRQRLAQVTSDQYAQAVLTVQTEQWQAPDGARQKVKLSVSGGGANLFSTWVLISSSPAANARAPRPTGGP
jgi:hypothetical protein